MQTSLSSSGGPPPGADSPSSLPVTTAAEVPAAVPQPERSRPAAAPRAGKVHVRIVSRPGVVFIVPTDRVEHMPASARGDEVNLLLCPHYDPRSGLAQKCPAGPSCEFVHADLSGAESFRPHERNPVWRCREHVPYDFYPTGTPVELSMPNRGLTTQVADSGMLLRTRALECERRPLSHCAHFLLKGLCHRGSECLFVHYVTFEASAADTPATAPRAAQTASRRGKTVPVIPRRGSARWHNPYAPEERKPPGEETTPSH